MAGKEKNSWWKPGAERNKSGFRKAAYYSATAGGYNELHQEEQLQKIQIILDNLDIKENDRLLDVGCGTGFSLDLYGCESIGLEPSEEMINQYEGDKKIVRGSAEKIPFDDDEFDIVVSVTAVQNFEDFEKGLEEMKRVGKEKFALTVLKKSPKAQKILSSIEDKFQVDKIIEEDKDWVIIAS